MQESAASASLCRGVPSRKSNLKRPPHPPTPLQIQHYAMLLSKLRISCATWHYFKSSVTTGRSDPESKIMRKRAASASLCRRVSSRKSNPKWPPSPQSFVYKSKDDSRTAHNSCGPGTLALPDSLGISDSTSTALHDRSGPDPEMTLTVLTEQIQNSSFCSHNVPVNASIQTQKGSPLVLGHGAN